jgi:hypothetical protein
MWFGYKDENSWIPVEVKRVDEILKLNEKGKFPSTLHENEKNLSESADVLNRDLELMDKKFENKSRSKSKRNKNRRHKKSRRK